VLKLLANDEMNADKNTGFFPLPSYFGSIEWKKTSNENCMATINNVQQCKI
jgi:hypothetical protein